jgi:hypothetical protein
MKKLGSATGTSRLTELTAHGDYIPFHVSAHNIPTALVNAELCLAMGFGVRIGSGNNICRRVADAEIQYFALLDKNVQGVHQLFD